MLTIDSGVLEVVAMNCDTGWGGADLDQHVIQRFSKVSEGKLGKGMSKHKRTNQKRRRVAEKTTSELNSKNQARRVIEALCDGVDLSPRL